MLSNCRLPLAAALNDFASETGSFTHSECLPYREVKADPPRLFLAVDQQARYRIQLITHIEPNRANRGVIAQAWSDVVPKVVEIEVPRVRPHVTGVDERDRAQVAPYRHPQLARRFELRVSADRISLRGQRAHLESPPATQAGRAADEV